MSKFSTRKAAPQTARTRISVRNVRLVTGLVLFSFVLLHLINHALGLVSIEAMEAMRSWRVALTRSLPGTTILLMSAVIHAIVGVEKIVSRRISAISPRGLTQIATGILIPVLLANHLIGTRVAHELFGVKDSYDYVLWALWPNYAWRQALLIALVWGHATIGLYMWLRLKDWFKPIQGVLFALAVLIPTLAFAGFAVAGRKFHATQEFARPITDEQYSTLVWLMDLALYLALALIAAVALIKLVQWFTSGLKPRVAVTYNGSVETKAPAGLTLLEISQGANIPHASVCGGRARCSTCRVQIVSGAEQLDPPGADEARTLKRAGISDPSVRLACQIRPQNNISVIPLVPTESTGKRGRHGDKYDRGVEKTVTLMFIDIRGFTKFSEGRLPYDVVHILNQYIGRMSEMITINGGYVDKFMGDGIMAIFGMGAQAEAGAVQALKTAVDISKAIDKLNAAHSHDLKEPMRIGIGIHTGEAILGRVGASSAHGAGERITALGDTVNTASRLEALTKELQQELVVSCATLEAAGIKTSDDLLETYAIRGRASQITGLSLAKATQLNTFETG